MKQIKNKVIKGKKGDFNMLVFPGHKEVDMLFPAFCVVLRVKKVFKGASICSWFFTAVMN